MFSSLRAELCLPLWWVGVKFGMQNIHNGKCGIFVRKYSAFYSSPVFRTLHSAIYADLDIIIIVHLWCAYYKKDIGALQSQRWVKSMNKRLTNIKCRTEKVSFKMFPKDCRVWFRRFKNKIQNIFCGGNTVLPQTTFHLGGKLLIKTPPNPTTSWPSYCRIPDIKSYIDILYKICSFK